MVMYLIVDLCGNKVAINVVGEVRNDLLELCLKALKEILCRCCKDLFLELMIYGSRNEKLAFLEEEARDLGVLVIGDFKTLHEAWRGFPRIHVSQEDVQDLDRDVLEALVAHEAMHAYLHGSIASYVIYIPNYLLEKFEDPSEAFVLAYIIAAAIKDLEVHRAMLSMDLRRYLLLYASFCASQLSDSSCGDSSSLAEIANSMKLLTPFYVLNIEPPKCSWLMKTKSFKELVKADLDSVHKVIEVLLEEFAI